MPRKHYISKRASCHLLTLLFLRWGIIGALLVIVLIAIVAFLFGLPGGEAIPATQPAAQSASLSEITAVEAYQKYQAGVFFLDVRESEEWESFHIPNTVLIPLDELPDRLNNLPRDTQIVVVCNSGNRSQMGRDTLLQAGFTDVTSMAGGVTGWSNAGYPIEGTRP